MEDKRGQFYLIAAVIIVGLVIGFAALRNRVMEERGFTKVYDLGDELNIETANVYDYGIFDETRNPDELIQSWREKYSVYAQGKIAGTWILIYGDGDAQNLEGWKFDKSTASGRIDLVGITEYNVESKEIEPTDVTNLLEYSEDSVKFTLGEFEHEFPLKSGENFFFIIESGGFTAES